MFCNVVSIFTSSFFLLFTCFEFCPTARPSNRPNVRQPDRWLSAGPGPWPGGQSSGRAVGRSGNRTGGRSGGIQKKVRTIENLKLAMLVNMPHREGVPRNSCTYHDSVAKVVGRAPSRRIDMLHSEQGIRKCA